MNDSMHFLFIKATANIFADCLGINYKVFNEEEIKGLLKTIILENKKNNLTF